MKVVPIKNDYILDEWYINGARSYFFGIFLKKEYMLDNELLEWFKGCKYPVLVKRMVDNRYRNINEELLFRNARISRNESYYNFIFFSKADALLFKLTWG